MKRRASAQTSRIAAIEIRRAQLIVAVIDSEPASTRGRLRTRIVEWNDENAPIYSESGTRQLGTALRRLAAEEGLAGAKVNVVLDAECCVTRVVTGTMDRVRRELSQLEGRSALYIAMGPGAKALATGVEPIDARHHHALLAVTNRAILDALIPAASAASMQLRRIEPSLVALARAIGQQGADSSAPVLILGPSETGAELGISDRGKLLLEYRIATRDAQTDVADVVVRHLKRLRRYCERHSQSAHRKLERIVLARSAATLGAVRDRFAVHTDLMVDVLDPATIRADWLCGEEPISAEFGAALGSCLFLTPDTPPELLSGPNFLEGYTAGNRQGVWPAALRLCWPVAAALLLTVGMLAAARYERNGCDDLARQGAALEAERTRALHLQRDRLLIGEKVRFVRAIAQRATNPNWAALLSAVAGCLPQDAWLEKFTVDAQGRVAIAGTSYHEDTVYEVVRWLSDAPGLTRVSLTASASEASAGRAGLAFDVGCELAGRAEPKGSAARND